MGVALRGFGLCKAKQTKVSISDNEGLHWRMPKTSFGNPLISEFIYQTPKKILFTEAKTISSQNAFFRFFQQVIAKMFLWRSFKRPEAEYKCVARLYNHDKWLNLRKRGEGRGGGGLHLISSDVLAVKMQLKTIPRKEYFCQETRLSEEANSVHCHHDGPFLH